MNSQRSTEESGPTSIKSHLKTALEETKNETAKFHLREAVQKCIILSEDEYEINED